MGCRYPSLYQEVWFWRSEQVHSLDNCGDELFDDEKEDIFVPLGNAFSAIVNDKTDKFYQQDQGVVRQVIKYAVLVDEIELVSGDHVTYGGISFFIEEVVSQAGVTRLRLSESKSLFRFPLRIYRRFSVGASIE